MFAVKLHNNTDPYNIIFSSAEDANPYPYQSGAKTWKGSFASTAGYDAQGHHCRCPCPVPLDHMIGPGFQTEQRHKQQKVQSAMWSWPWYPDCLSFGSCGKVSAPEQPAMPQRDCLLRGNTYFRLNDFHDTMLPAAIELKCCRGARVDETREPKDPLQQ